MRMFVGGILFIPHLMGVRRRAEKFAESAFIPYSDIPFSSVVYHGRCKHVARLLSYEKADEITTTSKTSSCRGHRIRVLHLAVYPARKEDEEERKQSGKRKQETAILVSNTKSSYQRDDLVP